MAPAQAQAPTTSKRSRRRKQLADARKQLEATEWDLRAADGYRRAYETGQWDDGSPATARAEGAEMMRFVAGSAPAAGGNDNGNSVSRRAAAGGIGEDGGGVSSKAAPMPAPDTAMVDAAQPV